ncbi:hypothetical protein DVH24_036653 [Malus domestica]|uniref:F-box domain-containing protein n=1 Tax=Malus domestica TaxID=3750 RepID=A0A498IK09_MALDO|nr:hypothetical protein DVH24_036653 [Malus domestica]
MANNSCSDLPIPILNLITERLPYYDFVRSAAVCKTWQQAFHDGVQARCKNLSIWVMNHGCFNHDGEIFSILELSDPSTEQTYSIRDIITQEVRELFVDAKPCASRYGWLLLTKKVKVEDGSSTKFFFYIPFKNKVIELSSPLILTNKIAGHKATFTERLEAWDMIDCSVFANKIRCSGCENCYSTSRYVYYLVEVPFSKVYLVAQQDHYHELHAFEYDGSDNKWFEVESFIKTFENRALFIKGPSSVAIEEFSDEFKGVFAGKYSINRLICGFKTNCKPACDIFKEFARLGDFLTESLIQIVPEVSIIHKHAHDDDTQILSPSLLPQLSASLLVPVEEEDMTRKEIEREMESKMELKMKRKKDRNVNIRYDYDMQDRRDRKWKRWMEMQREIELEREMEREIEREWESERQEQDLVPSSPPHSPQTPTNAVPVVEERRREKDNKREKKQRKKARRNTMQRGTAGGDRWCLSHKSLKDIGRNRRKRGDTNVVKEAKEGCSRNPNTLDLVFDSET